MQTRCSLSGISILGSVVLSSGIISFLTPSAYAQANPQISGTLVSWAKQGEQNYLNEIFSEGQQQWQRSGLEKVLERYQKASSLDPNNSKNLASIAYLQAQLKNFQAATVAFQKAIALEPNNPNFYYGLGYSLANLGDNSGSEKAYRQATQLAPNQVENYIGLGAVLTRQNAYESAILAYLTALSLQPDNASIFESLGALYLQRGAYNRAVEMLEQAVQLAPDRPRAQSLLALALTHADRPTNPVKELQTPISSKTRDVLSFVKVADGLNQAGERSLAMQLYQWTEGFAPNCPGLQEKMGNLWMEKQNYVMAVSAYRRWTEKEPENPDAYYNLGTALYQMGRLKEAISMLEKASTLYQKLLSAKD